MGTSSIEHLHTNVAASKKFSEQSKSLGILNGYAPRKRNNAWMDTPAPIDDGLLLTRIAQRDQFAMSELYDRYARIIYGLALKSLRSAEESEEVVLDVFAQVWKIADRYDVQKGRADTWLFMLARSRILDRLRKIRTSQSSATLSIDTLEIQPKADNVDLFEDVFVKERQNRISAAMQTVPAEQRLVLELAYYQGLTQSQIAAQTGMTLGTVKTRTRLGLNKLKSALGSKEDL